MWAVRRQELATDRGSRFALEHGSQPATFADVIAGWRTDAGFRLFFSALLADTPFTAFRWETPAVTTVTLTRPFECVLLDDPSLARRPDQTAFAEQFTHVESIAAFPNLSRDAILVVPCPLADHSAYGHLAAFLRHAPDVQRDALWRAVGDAMSGRVGSRPVWLSTAGAGVPWLHVRLDDRPKYYGFAEYPKSPL